MPKKLDITKLRKNKKVDEDNVSGNIGVGAGPIQTPKAFTKKGQKTNAATAQAERSGWKKVSGMPKKSKVMDYKELWKGKKSAMNEASKGVTGAAPEKGSRIFIPKGFELPEEMFKPYTVGDKDRKLFKIVSKGDESILLIDDLARVALGAIEKGRTSFEKEQRLPIVARILKDILPSSVRGIIKKATVGVNALPNGYVPVPVKITHENLTGFGSGASTKNNPIQITERGLKLLKAVKENPAKFEGVVSPGLIQLLIYLLKNKDTKTTPGKFADESGTSIIAASRFANELADNNFITMEKSAEPEIENTDKWYIYNPGASEKDPEDPEGKAYKPVDSKVKGIGTNLYEHIEQMIKQELLNESSYNKFKNEVKYRTKSEQLHKAIREVKRKVQEIDRIVDYTQRMKLELSEGDGIQYWTRTEKAVAVISEMVNHLNNKIKNLHQ